MIIDASSDTFEVRRDAIDVIGTIRTRHVRVALFAYLLLPNSHNEITPQQRASYIGILREQLHFMEEVSAWCAGECPSGQLPETVKNWIFEIAKNNPVAVAQMSELNKIVVDIIQSAQAGSDRLQTAINDHVVVGRQGFAENVTGFCNQLWASLDEKREQETALAREATKAVAETLSRLEHIGRHVRLVSLNASVEAARVGDAGRGLAVIATEFKTLAEEIQSLSTTARNRIDSISQNNRH